MTPPNSLIELAERVERLTGPCRETDALIARALGWTVRPLVEVWFDCDDEDARFVWIMPNAPTYTHKGGEWINSGYYHYDGPPTYTASLDAAMTLRQDWMSIEICESAANDTLSEPRFTRCRVWDWRRSPTMSDPGNEWKAEGNRPLPLNICAAILRARAASESPHG